MKDYLIVVDMQTDFVDGALGTKEAVAIVPHVKKRIDEAMASGEQVIFTRDTHQEDYLMTQEGCNLPVRHCIEGTDGWQIIPELREYAETVVDKPTFGSTRLGERLALKKEDIGRITLIGCPKLDGTDYSEKLTQIFAGHDVRSITVVRMEVPCCGGLTFAVQKALEACGKEIPLQVVTITRDGRVLE